MRRDGIGSRNVADVGRGDAKLSMSPSLSRGLALQERWWVMTQVEWQEASKPLLPIPLGPDVRAFWASWFTGCCCSWHILVPCPAHQSAISTANEPGLSTAILRHVEEHANDEPHPAPSGMPTMLFIWKDQ